MLQREFFKIKPTGICLKILWSPYLFIKQQISEMLWCIALVMDHNISKSAVSVKMLRMARQSVSSRRFLFNEQLRSNEQNKTA